MQAPRSRRPAAPRCRRWVPVRVPAAPRCRRWVPVRVRAAPRCRRWVPVRVRAAPRCRRWVPVRVRAAPRCRRWVPVRVRAAPRCRRWVPVRVRAVPRCSAVACRFGCGRRPGVGGGRCLGPGLRGGGVGPGVGGWYGLFGCGRRPGLGGGRCVGPVLGGRRRLGCGWRPRVRGGRWVGPGLGERSGRFRRRPRNGGRRRRRPPGVDRWWCWCRQRGRPGLRGRWRRRCGCPRGGRDRAAVGRPRIAGRRRQRRRGHRGGRPGPGRAVMLDVVEVEHHRLGHREAGPALHVLEVPRDLDRLLWALPGVGVQARLERLVHARWQVGAIDAGDRHLQDPQQQRRVAVGDLRRLLLGRPAGDEGVDRRRQGVHVGRRAHVGALQHLGRGVVADRVVQRPEPGEHRELGQPGLGQQRLAVGAEHQPGRRQVAVHDPGGVRRLQRPGQKHPDLQRPLGLQRALLREDRVERVRRLRVGDHPRASVVGEPPLVDRDHAGVHPEPLRLAGGGVESLPGAPVTERWVERDRHRPAQPVAGRGEQAARDTLSDQGEVAAPGDEGRVPSHDDAEIYIQRTPLVASVGVAFGHPGRSIRSLGTGGGLTRVSRGGPDRKPAGEHAIMSDPPRAGAP